LSNISCFQVVFSVSPTLLEMLQDQKFGQRFVRYLDMRLDLACQQMDRCRGIPEYDVLSRFYYDRFAAIREQFLQKGPVIERLKALQQQGFLELITTCATHGYLPLLSEEARYTQIRVGLEAFRRAFGFKAMGFWLPECGYTPGVEEMLSREGINFFVVDEHAFTTAWPPLVPGAAARVGSVTVFNRDKQASEMVWNAQSGYPSHPHYRDFYRDLGFDFPGAVEEEFRHNFTGLKYQRITGKTECKEAYLFRVAEKQAALDAHHYAEYLNSRPDEVVVLPFDAELFGHWWFEGPEFLYHFLPRIQTVSPLEFSPRQQADLCHTSWGRGGYSEVWLNPKNDWIYHELRSLEHRYHSWPGRLTREQTTLWGLGMRALLGMEDSDWAFILDAGTAVDFARRKLAQYARQARKVLELLEEGGSAPPPLNPGQGVPFPWLEECLCAC